MNSYAKCGCRLSLWRRVVAAALNSITFSLKSNLKKKNLFRSSFFLEFVLGMNKCVVNVIFFSSIENVKLVSNSMCFCYFFSSCRWMMRPNLKLN